MCCDDALALCDGRRLFSHVDDPFLDDPLPREYVLYLRPSGPLQNQLHHFWQQSRVNCGKNKAHNIFPHITLCQFFMVSLWRKRRGRRRRRRRRSLSGGVLYQALCFEFLWNKQNTP